MSSKPNKASVVPPAHPALLEYSKMYETPQIIEVTDHVYVAFNYAIANMIMVEGMNDNKLM